MSTKILVVDDMMTMRKIVRRACMGVGFTDIVDAKDGQLAWEVVTDPEAGIQLVISDWNMPNCSGLDLLKRVRGDSRYKDLPFLLVTAESEQSQIVEALKAGVDNYLMKPFTQESLTEKLEQVYKKRNP